MAGYWRTKDIGFTGISYPFRVDGRGSVSTSTVDLDADITDSIREGILQLILTKKGERFFNRGFGAAPVDLLFRRNLPEEMMLFASELEDILSTWEPRVLLSDFEVLAQYESTAMIRIGFQIALTQLEGFVEAEIPLEV